MQNYLNPYMFFLFFFFKFILHKLVLALDTSCGLVHVHKPCFPLPSAHHPRPSLPLNELGKLAYIVSSSCLWGPSCSPSLSILHTTHNGAVTLAHASNSRDHDGKAIMFMGAFPAPQLMSHFIFVSCFCPQEFEVLCTPGSTG